MTLAQFVALWEVENPPPDLAAIADFAPYAKYQGGS